MKKLVFSLLAIASFSFCFADSVQDEMIHDLRVAKYNFANKYAPQGWKNELFGWSLEESFQKAQERVLQEKPQTIADYQKIFKEFILSTRDYHVNVAIYSTSFAWYPLIIKRIEGRYYVASTVVDTPVDFFLFHPEPIRDFELYLDGIEKIAIGDEVVEFDGVPIGECIETIIDEELKGDRSPTGYAIAEKMVFNRSGTFSTASSTFALSVIHDGAVKPVTYTLPWLQITEKIEDQPLRVDSLMLPQEIFSQGKKKDPKLLEQLLNTDYSVKSVIPLLRMEQNAEEVNEGEEEEEKEPTDWRIKGDLPPLGEIIWESKIEDFLYAYIYKNPEGRKIGYVYLQGFSTLFYPMKEMVDLINRFEEEADGVVLDIRNNPGGNILHAYATLALFTDKPLVCPKQVETLIQQDLFLYASVSEILDGMLEEVDEEESKDQTIGPLPCSKKMLQECKGYTQEIFKTWAAGKRITAPLHLFGFSEIEPHPEGRFTKPLLVLVNELDFSCADLLPAILQDNQRATIFGTKTAGAGGYVKGYQNTSRFGIAGYTITGSLVYRSNGEIIENRGVTPDIAYELTLEDIKGNFAPFIQQVNKAISYKLEK